MEYITTQQWVAAGIIVIALIIYFAAVIYARKQAHKGERKE